MIHWVDLTVPDADKLRDFYQHVVGWTVTDVDMGGYKDYCMNLPDTQRTVAGICHARGVNAKLPPQWLIYITVKDLDKSIQACLQRGGEVLSEPTPMGQGHRYCVIKDPAGAVAALYEEK